MKLFFLLSALFIFSLYPHPPVPFQATVTGVMEGYCLELTYSDGKKENARLAYIKEPLKSSHEADYRRPCEDSVTAFISQMLKGKEVSVIDTLYRDADNRLLVKIWVDTIPDFNGYLIEKGYARAIRKGTPGYMYNQYSKY